MKRILALIVIVVIVSACKPKPVADVPFMELVVVTPVVTTTPCE